MVFSSLVFLFAFLPVFLAVYFLLPRAGRNAWLLVASLFFYAWGEPVYIVLMACSILANYVFGLLIARARGRASVRNARLSLVGALVVNLALLGVFKYTDFAIGTFNALFGTSQELLGIALPIGISFYTFQAMSYVIDVYRGDADVNRNIVSFGAYITMFPQLIAGPIVRYKTVADELKNRRENLDDFTGGVERFTIGLGKKVLIADVAGATWDTIAALQPAELTTAVAWLGIVLFTIQIYFDFSGYSDMAIGLGRMLGFHFQENFDYPYASRSITEFWRRWHISLGTWFRQYVYIPLGGNRKGLPRQIVNIAIVWLLTGLWHGASWNFVLWGAYYAVILFAEKIFLLKALQRAPRALAHAYTLLLVVISGGIFCVPDISCKRAFLAAILFHGQAGLVDGQAVYPLLNSLVIIVVGAIGSTRAPKLLANRLLAGRPLLRQVLMVVLVVFTVVLATAFLVSDTYNAFLYFRF